MKLLYTLTLAAGLVACAPAVRMQVKTVRNCTTSRQAGNNIRNCTVYAADGTIRTTVEAYDANGKLVYAIDKKPGSREMLITEVTPQGIVQSVDYDGDGKADVELRHNNDGTIDDLISGKKISVSRTDAGTADEPGIGKYQGQ